jgi:hypothetical protein
MKCIPLPVTGCISGKVRRNMKVKREFKVTQWETKLNVQQI